MKKLGFAVFGLCICLVMIYTIRSNPRYQMDSSVDGSRPVVAFVEKTASVGSPITVVTAGYARGTIFHYAWQVGETVIENDTEQYVPAEEDLQKFISVTVSTEDGQYEPQTIRLFFSKLPVCYLDTENGAAVTSKDEYIHATLKIQGNEQYLDVSQLYEGGIQIKGRGNTTWRNTLKKPYHIKLESDVDLFGMGAENDWMMLSNPFDQTLMRNALAFDLSGMLGLYQIEYTWVDVVLNGEYVGNYQVCEKIEVSEERIDIVDWENLATEAAKVLIKTGAVQEKDREALKQQLREDLSWLNSREVVFGDAVCTIPNTFDIPERTGGFVMELDMFYDEISKFTIGNQQFMFKDPQYALTNGELFGYAQEYVTAFYVAARSSEDFHAIYQGESVHYSELFDINSLVAYYLVQEIFFNEDGVAKSAYFYKDVGDLAHMGPIWDMDWSSNGEGDDAWRYDQWQTTFYSKYNQNHQWYKGLVRDPYFLSMAKKYWDSYREEIYSLVADGGMIDQMYEYLYESGMANAQLWPYRENGFEREVSMLKTWMTNRLNWLDKQFASLQTLVDSIGCFEYGLTTEFTLDGRTLYIWCDVEEERYPYAEIYVDGKKQSAIVLHKNGSQVTLPGDVELYPESVIQVRIYDYYGERIASNYLDLRQ